jgi:tRNA dimethylallyltransferase
VTQPTLLAIVGPTAAGKTQLSLGLAMAWGAEIVSADSRQIYRGMDIGTAKATSAERALAPHHLLDIVEPDQVLTLAEYQRLAYEAIGEVHGRSKLPLLVGGTWQYVRAVIEGWGIPEVAPQLELRAELEEEARRSGASALHSRLVQRDPVAAQRIDARNVRRVIRALEVCLVTGRPISELQRRSAPPFRVFVLGVTRERADLYQRIDQRVDRMLTDGLVGEVERLVSLGYDWRLPAMSALGYREIGEHLRGEASLEDSVAAIKRRTRRFMQQQHNWFGLNDPEIRWLDPASLEGGSAADVVCTLLGLPEGDIMRTKGSRRGHS